MDLKDRAEQLQKGIKEAAKSIGLDKMLDEQANLTKESTKAGFWDDSAAAQAAMKRLSELETATKQWQQLIKDSQDTLDLARLNDPALEKDLDQQITILEKSFESKKIELAFSGPYDDYDAIVSIFAGAGGTDAQDWTQMLLRMYSRWSESNKFKIQIIDESSGEEAGIKSVQLLIEGRLAYGKLRGEHGVHRLVRLSPFNADAKRQTSFAKVEVMPKIDRPETVPLDDKDLRIDVFRAGGHGGQSVNTTDSAVRVTHLPTNITVSIQNERSQLQNRETALTILRSKLAALQLEQHQEDLAKLKGPNQSAEWGNQIRSYVLHPYSMVKDLRTRYETSDAQAVLDGDLNPFIEAYLKP